MKHEESRLQQICVGQEEWKTISDTQGRYEVSSLGRVRSTDRVVRYSNGRVYSYKSKMLKPCRDKDGYLLIGIRNKNRRQTIKVHRAVAKAFICNPHNKREVNHINGIKTDNRKENLEWVSSSENKTHAFKIGLTDPAKNVKVKKGEEHYLSKTLIAYKDGVEVKRYFPICEAAKDGIILGTLHKQMKKGSTYKGMTFKKVKL